MDGSIQTIINFVGTKPDVPVNPGNAASTGDSLGLICVIAVILICLLALFLNRKLNVFRNFRAL